MTAAQAPRSLRLSSEARGMLPWCIALSAALHVLLLAAMAPAGPRLGGLARHTAGHAVRPISVRLLPAGSTPGNEAGAAAIAHAPATSAVPQEALVAASVASAAAPVAESSAASAAVATSAQDAASSTSAARSTPGDAFDGGYVPTPLLSIAPEPTAPVDIPAPPDTPDTAEVGRRVGVLALYIDEQGRVRRIDAEPPVLPQAMERAAREAFMAAHFTPGQVDGHVVRSRIRVEVVFDDGPLPAAAAASGAPGASGASSPSAARPASGQRSP